MSSYPQSSQYQRIRNRRPQRTLSDVVRDRGNLDITRHISRDLTHRFPIGCGSGGDVYRANYHCPDPHTWQTHTTPVVIKVLLGTREHQAKIEQRLNREIASWRNLKHENVVELLGIAYLDPNRPPGLVSRFVQRHNFLEFIGRHPELKMQNAQEVARGVQYLHANGVVHGDLKVDNIVVNDNYVAQLTDFGLAAILDVTGFTTVVSRNFRYTAPEMLPINESTAPKPSPQSDIFSLGILFLQLFHGPDKHPQRRLPYNHITSWGYDYRLILRIHRGERPLRRNYNPISNELWALMEWMWYPLPTARPTIAQVQHAL